MMVLKGVPQHIRYDNGPEFVAKDLRKWLTDTGSKTLYIDPLNGRVCQALFLASADFFGWVPPRRASCSAECDFSTVESRGMREGSRITLTG